MCTIRRHLPWLACALDGASPRYSMTGPGVFINSWEPPPTETQSLRHYEKVSAHVGAGKLGAEPGICVWRSWNNPPLSRWQIRLPWANPWAMSRDGAWRFEWMLLARMTALNDSNAFVAKSMAGSKHLICAGRWTRMWNFGLLNQRFVYCAAANKNVWISFSRVF